PVGSKSAGFSTQKPRPGSAGRGLAFGLLVYGGCRKRCYPRPAGVSAASTGVAERLPSLCRGCSFTLWQPDDSHPAGRRAVHPTPSVAEPRTTPSGVFLSSYRQILVTEGVRRQRLELAI